MKKKKKERLSLSIALDTLRHLGMNLYSSLPPVLSELVANAYDARARRVDIILSDDAVTIQDDGIGMDRSDVQRKYLVVGRDRRVDDPPPDPADDPFPDWPRRDKPMGRKGIGKLAMFSIASEVEVHSVKNGRKVAITMERAAIERAAKNRQTYYPKESDPPSDILKGSRIVLRDLKRQRSISTERVLKSIARRFSTIDVDDDPTMPHNDFVVYVDGTKVTAEHWDIFRNLQYMWHLGSDSACYKTRCSSRCRFIEVSPDISVAENQVERVSGWIGTVARPEQLKATAGGIAFNDNRIVVDCRGKVAIANFLHQYGEAGVYASYLAGYIRADYLDDGEDIATSDRERMQDDDPRVVALRSYVQKLLKQVQNKWTQFRRDTAAAEASQDPVVGEWIAGLNADEQDDAKRLLGRIGGARFSDESDRAQVLKYAILAFERLRVRHKLHLLRNVPDDRLTEIAAMFALESDLENALYADIANQRLEVIRKLEALVDADEKERVIQQHIFDHLWLLEPSWTIQDQLSKRLEQRVETEFGKVKLTKKEREGRIDIRYRKSGGVHIIVELKRPGVLCDVYDLLKQVAKYRRALTKCLQEVEGERSPNIQCVCLVGESPETGQEEEKALVSTGTRILTYDKVIGDSCKRFAEYLDAQKSFGRVQSILAKLDAVEPSE